MPRVDYKSLFDSVFGNKWILTGSAAVYLYAQYLNLPINFPVNDIDIIYINKDLFYLNNFQGFVRRQTSPGRSMTFVNESQNTKFDVSIQPKERYHLINGFRLVDPSVLLDDYLDNFSQRGKLESDTAKINTLKTIVTELKSQPSNIMSSK